MTATAFVSIDNDRPKGAACLQQTAVCSWLTTARIIDVWAGLLLDDRKIKISGRTRQNWTPVDAAVAWAVVPRLDY